MWITYEPSMPICVGDILNINRQEVRVEAVFGNGIRVDTRVEAFHSSGGITEGKLLAFNQLVPELNDVQIWVVS